MREVLSTNAGDGQPTSEDGIAVIGLAGRFPGARDVATFWTNLCAGVESISVLDDASLEDAFDATTRASASYVRARGILDDVDKFDAAFFGINPREAELIDPQHRVLLETAWEALEDAAIDPARSDRRIGIYAGSSINTYMLKHVMRDRATIDTFASDYQVGSFPTLVGGGSDFLATRIAYKLDLRGPAMTVQSACSTSLLAIGQAVAALRAGQADVMLAGAVSITFPQARGYLYQDGGMVSRDGHCRTFDVAADGTVFGAGAGMVVLKRLADARADGDRIYAVVRGVGINNDGSAKVGYTAPSVTGQATAIVDAHRAAGFDASTIDYVECHGTATPLGDPIEVAALAKAFERGAATRCAIGSVKPNVGHLDVAAGMAGFIKTTLALYHGTLPPTLHFTAPNPRLALDATPFYVNAELAAWPQTHASRRAGVSAFGVGGTNVHVVLESEPVAPRDAFDERAELLTISGRSDDALARNAGRLAAYLRDHSQTSLSDVARTLQVGRRAFSYRQAVVATTVSEAIASCESLASGNVRRAAATRGANVAFLFPGQGSQYVGMGSGLYASEPVFRAALDRCAEIVAPRLDADLRALLFPARGTESEALRTLTMTANAQPAIFAASYALSELLRSWGIAPSATAGHSVGEFVSATLAGVFALEDALRIVIERGRLMQALEPGAMLAVRLGEAELTALLPRGVALAAINSATQCVASGSFDGIATLEAVLAERDILSRRVATSHAFHSSLVEPIREPLAAFIAKIDIATPTTPYVSTATGTWITGHEVTTPEYWADHAVRSVRFRDALETLVESGVEAFLEVGPGTALATNARQIVARESGYAIASSLVSNDRSDGELGGLLEAVGTLWSAGIEPNWMAVGRNRNTCVLSLPTYAFEPTRHWIDAPITASNEAEPIAKPPSDRSSTDMGEEVPFAAEPSDITSSAQRYADDLAALLEELSGEHVAPQDRTTTFLELGFDSLFLGRFVQRIATRFGVNVTFRQVLGELPTLATLADHVAAHTAPSAPAKSIESASKPSVPTSKVEPSSTTALESLMRDQLAAMQKLVNDHFAPPPVAPNGNARSTVAANPLAPQTTSVPSAIDTNASRFEVFRVTGPAATELSAAQRTHIDDLIARVTQKTPKSKAYTQRYRAVLADPRVAAGFRAEWKEMVYPIVCERAAGSRLWDIDGNEYVDILNGFGQTAFGHAPDFVTNAVAEQLRRGFAIGPQCDVAGEVAERFCAMTGNERVTFCNTGSEAVMAAMRVARTVTGRDRIVVFGGAYHGQFDEVLVKGARTSDRSIPIAPGIPAASVQNITVLKYATPETLEWVRANADTLAAVVVEPVQSRHPSLQPKAFLQELRAITAASGTALVFDEVVTGFRVHPGGMQAVFGIRADLATYGKVVGGGMPVGILAGAARFMDALDGGAWSYDNDSMPEIAPTFFAGTFVRHPLVMQALLAVLKHLDSHGIALQEALSARTAKLVARLNADLESRGLTSRIETYASLFFFNFTPEERLAGLLYYHMRERGIYVQEGFPCFLTTAHGDEEIEAIVRAFSLSLDELQQAEIFTPPGILARVAPASTGIVEIPLTEEQIEIWLAAQVSDEATCAFNESLTLRLTGRLDYEALDRAFAHLVERHDSLRATFSTAGERMLIHAGLSVSIERRDVSSAGPEAAEEALRKAIAADARTPFDVVAGPLVRATVFRLGEFAFAFVFTAHHIVCDGWSINVVLEELGAAYAAFARGVEPALPRPLGYATYARLQGDRDSRELAAVETYWKDRFAEPVMPLALPTDRPRADERSFRGATHSRRIDVARYLAVKKAGARKGSTLFVTLFSAFGALVSRLSSSDDIVIAVPAAGQSLFEGETLVGHCVNLLPIRVRIEREARFGDVLAVANSAVLGAYDNQRYTLGSLVRALASHRYGNRLPLTELQFNVERLGDRLAFGTLDAVVEPNAKAFVNFDIFFNIVESSDGLRIDVDYNTDLFDATTIEGWLDAYVGLLDDVVCDADAPVRGALSVVGASSATGPADPYPLDATVVDLFAARVAESPNALAVMCGEERLSYSELDARANRLAHHLMARVGRPAARVAICVKRSIDLLIALLATQKAGFAYVPLDPAHPKDRLRLIVKEAGVAALVVDDSGHDVILAGNGASGENVVVHLVRDANAIAGGPVHAPSSARSSDMSAYVISTSGSTGVPKGVDIPQRAVVNLLLAMANRPGFTRSDALLAITTISFDIAALELYLPLVSGGTVIIADANDLSDGSTLIARLERSRATVMQATPSMWRVMLEAGFRPPTGFRMLCGGEALRPDVAQRLAAGVGELWNMYGPTETTIWSSCARVDSGATISVGTPIANTQFYILDEADRCVEIGRIGQLHIAGDGVARGYVDRPELTAERFIANPFGPGLLYRTGDSARMLPNGDTEILGRIDHQVKLRGFRIELGEIEVAIAETGLVSASVVTMREDVLGSPRIVAYYVRLPGAVTDVPAVRATLAKRLPEYMIPSTWCSLPALPLSANGKVDRNALPAPDDRPTEIDLATAVGGDVLVALTTPTERALGEIWMDVLSRDRIGRDDDIFKLGVDSIQIFKIAARANRAGFPLPAKVIFAQRTIGAIASHIDSSNVSSIDGAGSARELVGDAKRGRESIAI